MLSKHKYILGISAYYHDSAACLIQGGKILAAAQEERFTRNKHDKSFPKNSIDFCLKEAKINFSNISYIGFYDKPFLKFERILETYLSEAPRGFKSFSKAIPIWIKEKLFLKKTIIDNFYKFYKIKNKSTIESKLLFSEHHISHSASAFYPSPFNSSAILTMDGVGEWVTTSIGYGENNKINFLKEIYFPHSLGLLYSAFTYFAGFKVNSGEYKLMGLAPYGNPIYKELIKKEIIDIKEDGSFKLNIKYFNYTVGLTMTNSKFDKLFKRKPRNPDSKVTQFEMDLAKSIQEVIEEVILKLVKTTKKITNSDNLVLAGGVALNCVANSKIIKQNLFKNIWVQPASGDAGGALGVAQHIYFSYLNNIRTVSSNSNDSMNGCYLGKSYSDSEIKDFLDLKKINYIQYQSEEEFIEKISDYIINGKVVGWHQGRMEFGPRALGNRSILADPRNKNMQTILNKKIKFRESFRPFAPSILKEELNNFFDIEKIDSPYMLFIGHLKKNLRINENNEENLFGLDKLNFVRSLLPAITHVDFSSRIQTVDKKTNPKFYKLLKYFGLKTGYPILVNTSFNIRGEPIVCSPKDSYNCFIKTKMDVLALENFIILKN
ncbi:MAG: hypothetical protein CMF98_05140 [Candidatus Marinimicrobia bacterium]|nr:hypothetical protein [Candidatus Neomarinimicrobiota bacterium]OUW50219.1 MAG: hypothetical protein CBD50_03735 [bacterium TMED190]